MLAKRVAAFAVLQALIGCGPTPPEPFDCTQSQAVCTVVGTGAYGFNGDGLDPLETFLYFPTAVQFLASGEPFFADFNNLRIRSITDSGTVSTLAGSGFHSFAAAGPADASPLENPVDVAPDSEGGFFIAELHAARLLHVDTAGELTVMAGNGVLADSGDGGPAREATFSEFNGIAVGEGRVYISDTDNHRIRVYDPSDDTVQAVAGTGEPGWTDGPAELATFNGPQHLTWTPQGLYIADRWNHTIRFLDFSDNTVQTVAGNGTRGSNGLGGPAIDAQLNEPHAVTVGDDGTLWIADTENHRLCQVDLDGTLEVVVGTGQPDEGPNQGLAPDVALYRPQNVVIGPEGHLWISDTLNSRVRVWVP